jgi:hypothetical protein
MKLFSRTLGIIAAWSFAMLATTASPNVEASTAIVNVNTGLCMDMVNNSPYQDSPFQQYQCLGTPNQQFDFNTVSIDSVGNETVAIKLASTGMCVSIYQNSVALRTSIVQEPCDNSAQQQWKIGKASTLITFNVTAGQIGVGSARLLSQIVNVANGQCISVDPGTGNTSGVFQYTCGNVNNLSWRYSYF